MLEIAKREAADEDPAAVEKAYTEIVNQLAGDTGQSMVIALRYRAIARMKRGDYRAALEDTSRALTLDPALTTPSRDYALRGTAKALLGDAGGAHEDYDKALNVVSGMAKGSFQTVAYIERGIGNIVLGDLSRGLADLGTVVQRVGPQTQDGRHFQGAIVAIEKFRNGDVEGAIAGLKSASRCQGFIDVLPCEPFGVLAKYWEREVLAAEQAQERNFLISLEQYRGKAKPPLPENARRFRVQAEIAFEHKRLGDAARLYGEALRFASWWPEGYFNRAMVLADLRRYPEAIREMKRFLALEPDHPHARAAQDQIYGWEGASASRRR